MAFREFPTKVVSRRRFIRPPSQHLQSRHPFLDASFGVCVDFTVPSYSCRSIVQVKSTQYTIDDSVCLPTKKETLQKAVHKACRSLDLYLEKKPAAAHTQKAFEILVEMIDENQHEQSYEGIILDSGCGTGRSTKLLSSSFYPNHLVIGIDRSLARLTKTADNRQGYNDTNETNEASERAAYCHKISDNAYLVRAELVDFWRCCIEHGWTDKITHHYMLYPNPYPTPSRLSSRWYAHPSFPLILKLGVPTMVIRSNWEGYLNEFAAAVEMANEFYLDNKNVNNLAHKYVDSARMGPTERTDKSVALTNFESKYDAVGERTFELILEI